MKVICNVSSNNIGGIVNFLKGVSSSAKRNDNFEFFGLEILKEGLKEKPNFSLFINHIPYILPSFFEKGLFDDAKTFNQLFNKLRPIIDWEKEVIAKVKPDIILIYGTFWAPWCLLKAAEEMNIPVIHYYAGSLVLETINYRKYQREIFLKIEKEFYNPIIKTHIFPSQIARRRIEDLVHQKELINSVVIHSGIDTAYFLEKPGSINRVGFVFRWTEVKNKEIVLKLGEINGKRGKPLDFSIVTDIKPTHKDFAILNKYFTILPPMDYRELIEFYASCSVMVCLSNFETFGNVPLESVFAGTPALINKNMGVFEVFHKLGLNDLVIDSKDPEEIFNLIIKTQGRVITEDIRYSIRDSYSYLKVVDQYCDILLKHSQKLSY